MARTTALLTARLRQRAYTEDDLDALWRLWTEPDVRRHLWDDAIIGREEAAVAMRDSIACTATHGFGHWAVTWRDDSELIGFCGLRPRGDAPAELELIYGLHPSWWGRGLATEAARAWLRYGFETLGRARIWALTDAANVRSEAVMRRLGMGLRQRLGHDGAATVRYAIHRADFAAGDAPYEVRR